MSRTMVDLCAGTGAFTYSFNKHKIKCVYANDIMPQSKQIYDLNFSHPLTVDDIHNISVDDIPSHDILTAGIPCQAFSIAGKQQGFDDPRSHVFWKVLEVIDKHSPNIIIIENVKNLVSHDKGRTFEIIKSNLTERGYNLCYNILDTHLITGIPHHRERIYIVCIKSEKIYNKFNLEFPQIKSKPLSYYLEKDVPQKYYYSTTTKIGQLINDKVINTETVYQYRRYYVRENKKGVCPTLTANMGTGGHNVPIIRDARGVRKLTPRECFNLQGFPKTFKLPNIADAHLYKLAGNAVSVPVIDLIISRLSKLLTAEPLNIKC